MLFLYSEKEKVYYHAENKSEFLDLIHLERPFVHCSLSIFLYVYLCSVTFYVIIFWIELICKDDHVQLDGLHTTSVLFFIESNIFIYFNIYKERA